MRALPPPSQLSPQHRGLSGSDIGDVFFVYVIFGVTLSGPWNVHQIGLPRQSGGVSPQSKTGQSGLHSFLLFYKTRVSVLSAFQLSESREVQLLTTVGRDTTD